MIEQNFKCPEKLIGFQRYGKWFSSPPILEFEEGPNNTLHFDEFSRQAAKNQICLSAYDGENGEMLAGIILQ